MHSPADRARSGVEWVLRVAALGLLAWYLVHSIRARSRGAAEAGATEALHQSLARWTTRVTPSLVHVTLAHPPAGLERDWFAALSGAGTAVEWSGSSLLPTAVVVEPRADPGRGVEVGVAAPAGSSVVLRDTLGKLDSARTTAAGARVHVPKPRPTIDAVVGPVSARGARHDPGGELAGVGAAEDLIERLEGAGHFEVRQLGAEPIAERARGRAHTPAPVSASAA